MTARLSVSYQQAVHYRLHVNRLAEWGRRGGRVDVKVAGRLAAKEREAVEAEALSLPIPNATMSVTITEER